MKRQRVEESEFIDLLSEIELSSDEKIRTMILLKG